MTFGSFGSFEPKKEQKYFCNSAIAYKMDRIINIMAHYLAKGQLISKAIYGLLTSPKKRTDEFVLFAF